MWFYTYIVHLWMQARMVCGCMYICWEVAKQQVCIISVTCIHKDLRMYMYIHVCTCRPYFSKPCGLCYALSLFFLFLHVHVHVYALVVHYARDCSCTVPECGWVVATKLNEILQHMTNVLHFL